MKRQNQNHCIRCKHSEMSSFGGIIAFLRLLAVMGLLVAGFIVLTTL